MSQDRIDTDLFERLLARATPAPWGSFPDFMPHRTTETVVMTELEDPKDDDLPLHLMAVEHQPDGELAVFLRNHAEDLLSLTRSQPALVLALRSIARSECTGPGHATWQKQAAFSCPRCIARVALAQLKVARQSPQVS